MGQRFGVMLDRFPSMLESHGPMGFQFRRGIVHLQTEFQMLDHLLKMQIPLFAMTQPDTGMAAGLRPYRTGPEQTQDREHSHPQTATEYPFHKTSMTHCRLDQKVLNFQNIF